MVDLCRLGNDLSQLLSTVCLFLVLLLNGHSLTTIGQKLPTRDEEHYQLQIRNIEIFYDTKLLPDGAEVSTYLYAEEKARLFFLVEEDDIPASLIVTPCTTEGVRITLTHQGVPKEDIGPGQDLDELLAQGSIHTASPSRKVVLEQTAENQVVTYRTQHSPAGLYILELQSPVATSVRILASTAPDADNPYPLLPSNPGVSVRRASSNKGVTFTWKPSPTAALHQQPVEYCVFVNTRHNMAAECAARAYKYGEVAPTAPPHAGFGFAWEKTRRKPLDIRPAAARLQGDTVYTCIGSKRAYTFSKAAPGKTYFLDVYAVNTHWNTSTSYVGTSARIKLVKKKMNLRDAKVVTSSVKTSRPKRFFKYTLRSDVAELTFALEPCYGTVAVDIDYKGELLNSSIVADELTTFTFPNSTRGTYNVKVKAMDYQSASFRLLATADPARNPYPFLPERTDIRVLDSMTTCSSLTVAWLGSPAKLQYCLYVTKIEPEQVQDRPNRCLVSRHRKKAKKVVCQKFRAKNERSSATSRTIANLDPGGWYAVDVFARGRAGRQVMYQRAAAQTLSPCPQT